MFRPTPIIIPVQTQEPSKDPEPEWTVMACVPPENTGLSILQVTYTNEIGSVVTVYARAVFESKTAYKLVAPWLGTGRIVQKGDRDFQAISVSEDEKVQEFLK